MTKNQEDKKQLSEAFGAFVLAKRQALGLKQADVAAMMGIDF